MLFSTAFKGRRVVLPIMISAACLVLLTAILIQSSSKQEPLSETVSQKDISPENEQPRDTNLFAQMIARETLLFMDTLQRPGGSYQYYAYPESLCKDPNDSSTCPFGGKADFQESIMWPLWARLSYHQRISHDPADLQQIRQDAKILFRFCDDNEYRCRAMMPVLYQLAQVLPDEEVKETMDDIVEELEKTSTTTDPMVLAIEARSLFVASEYFSDISYADEAKKRLSVAEKEAEVLQRASGVDQSVCYRLMAYTEGVQRGGSSEVKDQALVLWKRAWEKDIPTQLIFRSPCIEAGLILSRETGDPDIGEKAASLVDEAIHVLWDGSVRSLKWGSGGFFSDVDTAIMTINDAGYMVHILSLSPDQRFSFISQEGDL